MKKLLENFRRFITEADTYPFKLRQLSFEELETFVKLVRILSGGGVEYAFELAEKVGLEKELIEVVFAGEPGLNWRYAAMLEKYAKDTKDTKLKEKATEMEDYLVQQQHTRDSVVFAIENMKEPKLMEKIWDTGAALKEAGSWGRPNPERALRGIIKNPNASEDLLKKILRQVNEWLLIGDEWGIVTTLAWDLGTELLQHPSISNKPDREVFRSPGYSDRGEKFTIDNEWAKWAGVKNETPT